MIVFVLFIGVLMSTIRFLVVSIERLRGSNSDEYNEEDEEIELEIVEVEELDEPVPTQDSCLQVIDDDACISIINCYDGSVRNGAIKLYKCIENL